MPHTKGKNKRVRLRNKKTGRIITLVRKKRKKRRINPRNIAGREVRKEGKIV